MIENNLKVGKDGCGCFVFGAVLLILILSLLR